MKSNARPAAKGFTLTELLIVILIILVLAVLGFTGIRRFIDNAKKTQAMAQFRDLTVGMTIYESEHGRPPAGGYKRDEGIDTIYGDPDPTYPNSIMVAVLAGDEGEYPAAKTDEVFLVREMNPSLEEYVVFPLAADGKNGVGRDGCLYDPWGNQVIMAVNGLGGRGMMISEFNSGRNDRRLHTWGLGEYNETKPRDESFVFWSYGKDGKKGDGVGNPTQVTSLKQSDDVVSW